MQSGLPVISKSESRETICLRVLELETKILCFSIFRKYVTFVTSSLVRQNMAAEIKSKSITAEKLIKH